MTIEIANIIRTSFGLSFDEVITIMGLHYGKDEWLVDLEIKESPVYHDVIQFLTELDSKAVKIESDAAALILNHLKQCKADKGIPVLKTKPSREDLERVTKWLKKGYTVEDFKAVNKHFVEKWVGTDSEQYLIPATLYKMGTRGGLGFTDKLSMAKESQLKSATTSNFSDAL